MSITDFYVPEAKLGRFAAVYGPSTGPGQAPTENGGIELPDAPATSPYPRPTRFLSGGMGLVSAASDCMRCAQMLFEGGEKDPLEAALAPIVISEGQVAGVFFDWADGGETSYVLMPRADCAR